MAQYPSDQRPRPRHSTTEDVVSAEVPRGSTCRFDDAYRGHRVVDDHHRPIGKVTDVIFDETGTAEVGCRESRRVPCRALPAARQHLLVARGQPRGAVRQADGVALAEGRTRPRAVTDHRTGPRALLPARRLTGADDPARRRRSAARSAEAGDRDNLCVRRHTLVRNVSSITALLPISGCRREL